MDKRDSKHVYEDDDDEGLADVWPQHVSVLGQRGSETFAKPSTLFSWLL